MISLVISTVVFVLIIAAMSIAIYVYFRREQDKFIPRDKYYAEATYGHSLARSSRNTIHLLWIGFGVMSIHFVISYALETSALQLILTAPSFILVSIVTYFLWISMGVLDISLWSFNLLYVMTSSFCYGIAAALLASKKIPLVTVSIVLILVCILGTIGICLMTMASQINA